MSQQRANTAAARPAANSPASNRAQLLGGQNPLTWGYCTRRRSKRRSPGELVDHVSLQLRYRAIRTPHGTAAARRTTRRHGTYPTHLAAEPANCQGEPSAARSATVQIAAAFRTYPKTAHKHCEITQIDARKSSMPGELVHSVPQQPRHRPTDQANGTAADHYDEMNTTTPATEPSRPTARQTDRRAHSVLCGSASVSG